jgi:23S rRNA (guanosine2251-2'-O)-methyltransferase
VALAAAEFVYSSMEWLVSLPLAEREPALVLDSIVDPHNVGAIARAAGYFGAKALILPRNRSAGITESVMRVSAGATSYLAVVQVTNLVTGIEQLKTSGLWVIGLDLGSEHSIFQTDLSVPAALVIGNEQRGIRQLVRQHCDILTRIPGTGPIASLNAASAAAVALAELQRQRLGGRDPA